MTLNTQTTNFTITHTFKMSLEFFVALLIGSSFLFSAFLVFDVTYLILLFLLSTFFLQFKVKIYKDLAYVSTLMLIYYLLIYFVRPNYNSISPLLNLFLSVSGVWVMSHILRSKLRHDIINERKIRKYFKISIWGVIAYLYFDVIENLLRLMEVGLIYVFLDEYAHYGFKRSVILSDTNSLCLMFICLFAMCFQGALFESFIGKASTYCVLIFAIFISFSKAGIFSFLLYLIFYYVGLLKPLKKTRQFWPIFYFGGIVAVAASSRFFGQLPLGESFLSKLHVLALASDYLKNATFYEIAFGVGLQGSLELFSMYSHIFGVTVLVEAGVIGVILQTAWLVVLARLAPVGFVNIMFPILVASMSYFPLHGMAWIYFCIMGIELLTQKKRYV